MKEREGGLYFIREKIVQVSGLSREEAFNAKDQASADDEIGPEPVVEDKDETDPEQPRVEDFEEDTRRYEEREFGEDGYIIGIIIQKVTPIESIEEVESMQKIIKMFPIKIIEEKKHQRRLYQRAWS